MTTAVTAPDLSSAQKRALLARLLAEGKGRAQASGFSVMFERQAALTPDAPAVRCGPATTTYRDLKAQAATWAQALAAQGIGAGAQVGVAMAPTPALVAALVGIARAGAAWVGLDAADAAERLARQRAGLAAVVTSGGLKLETGQPARADGALAVVWPDQTGVAVPERAVAERLAWLATVWPLASGDAVAFTTSLHDTAFVTALLHPLAHGATVVMTPDGAHMGDGPPIACAEAPGVFWHVPAAGGPVLLQPGGDAPSVAGADLRVVDAEGRAAPVGVVGELQVRPSAQAAMLPTGDWVRRRADGRFERRAGGVRRTGEGGLRPSLRDIETVLARVPGVAACRLLERSDATGDDRLVACVVPTGQMLIETWAAAAVDRLAPWQRPARWLGVDRLPLTAQGHVDEPALAALPVVDEDAAAQCEAALTAQPAVAEAAVVVRPVVVAEPGAMTLAVLPPLREVTPTARGPEPAADRPPAFAAGAPYALPAGAPATLTEALLRAAAEQPERGLVVVAADGTERRLRYGALLTEARAVAAGLAAAGLRPGDRAILQIADVRAHLPAFWGCVLSGVLPVTIAVSPTFAERTALVGKLVAAWELLGQPAIIAADDTAAALGGLQGVTGALPRVLPLGTLTAPAGEPPPVVMPAPEDVLFLQLSSGSTGSPKCIQVTHGGVVQHIHGSARTLGYGTDEVSLNWLPMDHVVPMLTWHLRDVYLGWTQVQAATADVLAEPLRWLDLIERYRVTRTWSPNFGLKLVADAVARAPQRRWDLSSLASLMNAGEQVTLAVCNEFLAATAPFGVQPAVVQPAFGMAEACTCMTYETGFDRERSVVWVDKASLGGPLAFTGAGAADATAFVRLGPPTAGVAIRIADGDGRVLPEGVIGRFQIKGGVITPGYLANADANRAAFVGDGWFNSGDLGFMRDGRLVLTGREKEMIVVNGANIYCYEIEDIVNGVAGVRPTFSAACSVPDAATGSEALSIFYVAQDDADEAEVAAAIRTTVTARSGLAPAHVLPLTAEAFPKTTSGKIQRTQLRDGLVARLASEARGVEVPAWFHREVWVPAAAEPPLLRPSGVSIVSAASAQAIAAALEGQLVADGVAVRRVEAVDAVRPGDAVVDLRALARDEPGETPAALLARAEGVHGGTLGLLNRLGGDVQSADLLVVTRYGLGEPAEPFDPVSGGLRGLLRTAAAEYPHLGVRQLDIGGEADAEQVARWIAAEIFAGGGEPEVARRAPGRLVPRLAAAPVSAPSKAALRLRWQGRYVVTGGQGAIGRAVVRHLLTRCHARLLVVGRGPAPADARAVWGADAERVLYRQADVADAAAMTTAFADADAAFGGAIEGAFHLAGTATARPLADEDAAGLAAAFVPKAIGARVLAQLLGQRPGCFLVNWSSVNAVFGGAGAGAYALGSAALGTPGHNVRGITVLWSRWRDLGMSATLGHGDLAEARGFRALDAAAALASLDAVLAAGLPAVTVGLDDRKPLVRARCQGAVQGLVELSAFASLRAKGRPAPAPRVLDPFGTAIPYRLAVVETWPRSADGHIDRVAVAALDGGASASAASTATVAGLGAVWRELLGRDVGPADNFFAAGGHSLAAARLVHRVRETFGVDLPLRVLFEQPTLTAMAGWIDGQTPGSRMPLPDCLVAVQPEGPAAPLFCVHPAGGSPWCYYYLAEHLGSGQPFYGFQAPGLLGERAPFTSVEALAAHYVDAMRVRQPVGPYRIGAWSSGGPVAFEMARQLEAAGAPVALVVFFDCAVMEADNPLRQRGPAAYARNLWRIGGYVASLRRPRSYADVVALARLVGIALPARPRDLRLGAAFWGNVLRALRLFNLNTMMGYRYRPGTLASPAVLFRAGAVPGAPDALEDELRSVVTGPLTRVDLGGNHMTMLLDPEGARQLAERLAPFLQDGEERGRNGRAA